MRYIAAYALAVMGGKKNPSADDLRCILGSVGVDYDQELADIVLGQLKGKNLDQIIEQGQVKPP